MGREGWTQMRNIMISITATKLLAVCNPLVTLAKEVCKGNSRVIGECFSVRGRLSVYQGYPDIRMWWVGTKRIFGIAGGEGEEIIPEGISAKLSDGVFVFGDYVVCPVSEFVPGHMQWVCVGSLEKISGLKEPRVGFREADRATNVGRQEGTTRRNRLGERNTEVKNSTVASNTMAGPDGKSHA